MAIPIIDSIINFLNGPIDTVLKRKLKDKNLEMEMKHEIKMELMNIPFKQLQLFEKRVATEYEHPNLLRDAVRPIITYTCWALYTFVKATSIYFLSKIYMPMLEKMTSGTVEQVYQNLSQIKGVLAEFTKAMFTEYDLYIMLTILGFWFGSKLLERVVDKVAKTGGVVSFFQGVTKGKLGKLIGGKEPEGDVYAGDV